MEFREVVRRRRMIRRFLEQPVPADLVDEILAHAAQAPSAGFTQGWSFLVVEEVSDRQRWWDAATPRSGRQLSRWLAGMRTAPVVIVVLISAQAYHDRYSAPDKSTTKPWTVPFWYVDAGMASLLMLLTATDVGLGACFFGIPASQELLVKDEFGIPDDQLLVGGIAVGWPDPGPRHGSPTRRHRIPMHQLVHRGRWGTS